MKTPTGVRARAALITALVMTPLLLFACDDKKSSEAAANVNGTIITMLDLDRAVDTYRQQFASQGQDIPAEQLSMFRESVLDSMIRKTVLLTAATSAGVIPDAEAVETQISNIKGQFNSEEEYEQALGSQGYTAESLRKDITEDITISNYIDAQILDTLVISEEEIAAFYEENSNYFMLPESVTASHILIQVASSASDDIKRDARSRIEAILAELKAGADFADLARERSDDTSGTGGGDLGTFGRGQMVAPFEEAAFALKPGEISGIVESQFGYHIILVRDKEAGGMQTLAAVREDIIDFLKSNEADPLITEFIETLVAEAQIERFLPEIQVDPIE